MASVPGGAARPLRMRAPDEPSPVGRVVAYCLLACWAFVVLFPLYWLAITSVKLPVDVNSGPFYLPWIDFQPSLHAWRYLFVDMLNDTLRPYVNTVIAALASSLIAVALGSMAAYALVRITYRPRLGSILMFVLCVLAGIVLVVVLGLHWLLAVAVALALFALLLLGFGRRFRRSLGNNDIAFWMVSQRILPPVTAVVPIYVLFQHVGLLDTRTALIITYVAVNIPKGITATLTGILFNVQASSNFDPQSATYDIRQGVSDGNGGTSVASGTGNITVATTGRTFIGLSEFSVLVTLTTPQALTGGEEYWFNLTPQCTDGAVDGSCSVGRIFLSNTTEMANEQFGHASPPYESFLNSSYFGFTWTNWCDASLGLVHGQCRFASFGLVGTAKKD